MLADRFKDWLDKKDKTRRAPYIYEGESRKQKEWEDWNKERILAKRAGKDEPPPPSPPVEPNNKKGG